MTYDWQTCLSRFMTVVSGGKKMDRVPFLPLAMEQIISRIIGITSRELVSSPKTYANATINTYEFLHSDYCNLSSAYAGPHEALAFAEANNRKDVIHWDDYKPVFIDQGAVCKTEEDIEKLEIPDHSKIKIWQTSFDAAKMIFNKTKHPQMVCLGIWSVVQELRGVKAYKDMKKNPDLLLKLCEKVYESQMDVYRNWKEKVGFPPLMYITAYAFNGTMMSFENAMKYEGQFLKRFQKEIGIPILIHNCGVRPYWEELCSEITLLGVQGSHPLEIDFWVNFKKKFPKVTIFGANIDVSRELLNGTPEIVELKVKENIDNLATGGRYAVSPMCALPWGVPLPNILAIPSAIQKYGKYPLKKQ
ncbi:MAG: hypothetical protein GY870_19400 [archaeon]|nr:hypothetical protein [archaeon]